MPATLTPAATTTARTPAQVLLTRRATVYLPTPDSEPLPAERGAAAVDVAAGVTLLEADLIDRGWLVSAPLRDALAGLPGDQLRTLGERLLADLDTAVGAHRPHVPLFRSFPHDIPTDTLQFWVDRVLTVLLQDPDAPCVLCAATGTVHPIAPCAHLVCHSCFDGANFSACPICHRRLEPGEPFLTPARDRRRERRAARLVLPERLRTLTLGTDLAADAAAEFAGLLARTGALTPTDRDDLAVLLDTGSRTDLSWLPERIPGRETKAVVLAWLLEDAAAHPVTVPAAAARIGTATDVLRLLVVRSGGDAGLVDLPRMAAVPRPLRRALLAVLDGLDLSLLTEDLHRHRTAWLRAAERLHPFEHAVRYPRAAAAFAALRGTPLTGDVLTATLRSTIAAAGTATVTIEDDQVRTRRFGTRVETALAAGDVSGALADLTARPGELLRRLDHLLRVAAATGRDDATAAVLEALPAAARRVSPAVLLGALGALRVRDRAAARRVFFPSGSGKAHVIAEEREPLPAATTAAVVDILTASVLRRASCLPKADVAVVDAGLDNLLVPFTERTASRALVTLPRGSSRPLPDGRTLRLFLHWMESDTRVDLDLSVALFNDRWEHVGTCDYTSLRYAGTGAVHSGDLTSAPPPLGASEFVDLDLDVLASAGVRYMVPVVFSYNNVAFDDMAEAFAGFMTLSDPGAGEVFLPRMVEQRFDLAGRARTKVPMVVDLSRRSMLWLDVVKGVTGTDHAVHRHSGDLAVLGHALTDLFASGARVSMGELATWHAAARARTVLVRHQDGSLTRFVRRIDEDVAAFAGRVLTWDLDGSGDGSADVGEASVAGLAWLVRGDISPAAGAHVYALHPAALDPSTVTLLAAADVAAALDPALDLA